MYKKVFETIMYVCDSSVKQSRMFNSKTILEVDFVVQVAGHRTLER